MTYFYGAGGDGPFAPWIRYWAFFAPKFADSIVKQFSYKDHLQV